MDITCVSDLHGYYPELPGGDLLIVAGDLTARNKFIEYSEWYKWLEKQDYKKIVWIAGNHDNLVQNRQFSPVEDDVIEYLCDSGTEFDGLKIWGSPWTSTFPGMNPHCKAFTCETDSELAEKWALIPNDIDILVTHSPSQGVLDEVNYRSCGSTSLIKPMIHSGCKLHVFGHIHESYGKFYNPILGITYVNASHVNERYQPVNKPVRILL